MKFYSTLLLLLFHLGLGAQIYISEYSASNLDNHLDSFGSSEDWVQITNGGDSPIDIQGWFLSDKEDKPTKWSFPFNNSLQPQESIMVLCSGRPESKSGELHASFRLSQTEGKDKLILSNPEGTIIDNISLQVTLKDHSRYRVNSESDVWHVCTNPNSSLFGCSTGLQNQYTTTPTILQSAGYYEGTIAVEIENNEANSQIRYTIDGTEVRNTSPLYGAPIEISSTTILKARAFSTIEEILPGKMDYATFFLNETFSLPIFSVGADQVIQLANGAGDLEPIGSVEYFTPDGVRQSVSYGELNRHGKDSWANAHRSLDFVCRDEMGYSKGIKSKLFETSDRDEFQRLMFRASGDDNYPTARFTYRKDATHLRDEYVQALAYENNMELDCRTVQRIILFLNGQYWGVYGLREKVADSDFTKEYYDQGKYDLEFITHWGTSIPRYGINSLESWKTFRDFILDEDMSIDSNYNKVDSELNLISLIDYFLANLNSVAADWLDWNTGWWRGLDPNGKHKKWGYILWDMDATFDYYINYTGIPNTNYDAVPCDLEQVNASLSWGEHEDIFLKLIEDNSDFRKLYFARYADIANTAYSCETMLETLDRLEADIDQEMPRHIDRWISGSYNEWKLNVDTLRIYVESRCELIHQGLIDCHEELTAAYDITLLTEPDGIGEIDFNTLDIESFPWQGKYFDGTSNDIKAKVFNENEDTYKFSHWESRNGNNISPNALSRKATYEMVQPDTLVAVFTPITNTKDLESSQNWNIYPNPTTGQITITSQLDNVKSAQIQLYNTMGQYVETLLPKTGPLNDDNEVSVTIPENVQAGVYIIKMKIDGRWHSKLVSKI